MNMLTAVARLTRFRLPTRHEPASPPSPLLPAPPPRHANCLPQRSRLPPPACCRRPSQCPIPRCPDVQAIPARSCSPPAVQRRQPQSCTEDTPRPQKAQVGNRRTCRTEASRREKGTAATEPRRVKQQKDMLRQKAPPRAEGARTGQAARKAQHLPPRTPSRFAIHE